MLVGMGTVFVFLTLLVATTTLMSRIALRLRPAQAPAPTRFVQSAGTHEEDIAVISAAIAAHRAAHRARSRGPEKR